MAKMTVEEFKELLDSIEPNEHGCKIWPRGKFTNGYPQVRVEGFSSKKGNKICLEMHLGRSLKDKYGALHTCDERSCVEITHLYEGTARQNSADAVNRHRTAIGDDHGSRRHPERRATGNRHGSHTHPEKWKHGDRHWTRTNPEGIVRGDDHWTRSEPHKLYRDSDHWMVRTNPDAITIEKAREIKRRKLAGESTSKLAREFKIHVSTVRRIAKGTSDRWKGRI